MRVLVTGGAGFIGSHFAKRLQAAGDDVRVLDKLTYSGNPANLDGTGIELVVGDICDAAAVAEAAEGCDAIVNFAAETHVDRSILGPVEFIQTNVAGTQVLLDHARAAGIRLVHVSTDEVYGDVAEGVSSVEDDPLRPSSPYSAAKAGGDLQVLGSVADVRRRRADHARLEHLRPEPVPGEADPADDDERASRASRCRSTATAARSATGSGSRITAPGSSSSCATARPERSTTSAATRSARTSRSSRGSSSSPAPMSRSSATSRTAPATTAATHSTRPSCAHSDGRRRSRSRRGLRRRSRGTSPTAAGGSRSSPVSTASTTNGSTRPGSPAPSPLSSQLFSASLRSRLISFRRPCTCSDRSSSSTTPSHCPSARRVKARL